MRFELLTPWLSLLIGFVGLFFTINNQNKSNKKEQQARDVEHLRQHEQIISSVKGLASKEFLDRRLKEEMSGLEKNVKTQIDNLKTDMKEQINEVKQDIKSQQEITEGMGRDVVRANESTHYAHERVTSVDKRIDDLRELFLSTQKKA